MAQFLTLPQQVKKNKDDIQELKDTGISQGGEIALLQAKDNELDEDIGLLQEGLGDEEFAREQADIQINQRIDNLPTPLHYVGTWNPSTNVPNLTVPDTDRVGEVYRCSTNGTYSGIDFLTNDLAVYNQLGYIEKWDITDPTGLLYQSDIANDLTTTASGKVLDARQGKVLDDKKLDKDTSVTTYNKVLVKLANGNPATADLSNIPSGGHVIQRLANGGIRNMGGNLASRPTTNLFDGVQYFNTTTKQLEVYVGDANHWLNQVYGNGDTLPTPAIGTSHTYHVISDGTLLTGTPSIQIDSEDVYGGATRGTTLIVTNDSGTLKIYNLDDSVGYATVSNLTLVSTKLALKRVA